MEILIYFITVSGFLYYVPSIYSIIKTKNATYYHIPSVAIECIYNGLLIYYAYTIDDLDLLQNNSIVFFLTCLELLLILYYSSYNKLNPSPSIHFSTINNENGDENV